MYAGISRAVLGGAAALPPAPPSGNQELWFDGDFVTQSGGVISAMQNQAPSGATRDASQATVGNRPIVGTALNGHGVVQHDGSNDYLSGVFGGAGYTYNDATIVTLSKRPATASDRALFDSAPAALTNSGLMMHQESAQRQLRIATPTNTTQYAFSSANWTVHFGIRRSSGTVMEIFEGTVLKHSATNSNPATLNNFRLGALFQDVRFWDGSWAQILLYSRALSSQDRGDYVSYVNTRYGLSLT